jgi:hypothetical protein
MLRFVYRWLLRLHPARFRERFAEEMLVIFDNAEEQAEVGLLTDGFVSLVRQWILRSEYWEEKAIAPAQSTTDSVPLFYTFESFKPRTSALIDGGILTVIVFYAVCLVLRYTWTHPVLIPFRGIQFQTGSSGNQSESSSSLLPIEVLSINAKPQSVLPELGRKSSKKVLSQSGNRASPQSRTQAVLSETLAQGRARIAVPPGLVMPPAIPSSSQSSGGAILSPKMSGETLRSYAGMYAADQPNDVAILITAEGGQLAIEVAGESKYALVRASETKFVVSGATYGFGQLDGDTVCKCCFYRPFRGSRP